MKKLSKIVVCVILVMGITACLFALSGCVDNDLPTLPEEPPVEPTPPENPSVPDPDNPSIPDPDEPGDVDPPTPPEESLEEIRAFNAKFTVGDLVALGSYPHTVVADLSIVESLATLAADERGIVDFEGKRYLKSVVNPVGGVFMNGDRIAGGTYYFEFKDIVWEVVAKNDAKLTLSSTAILDRVVFDENGKNVFTQSTLCKFLNEEWIRDSFTESQRAWIVAQTVDNPTFSGNTPPSSMHQVYLPSVAEWDNEVGDREKVYTDLVRAKGLSNEGEYWLRDGGRAKNLASIVSQQWVNTEGQIVTKPRGISPIVNIDVEQTTQKLESAYRVRVENRRTTKGTIYGGGTGTKAYPPILTAVPFNGFTFVEWKRNEESFSVENPLSSVLDGTYSAVFAGESGTIEICEDEVHEQYYMSDFPLTFDFTARYATKHYFSVGKDTNGLPFSVVLHQGERKILTVDYNEQDDRYILTDHTAQDAKTTLNTTYPRIPFDVEGGLTYTFRVSMSSSSNMEISQCQFLMERDKAIVSKIVQYEKTLTEYYIGEPFRGLTWECTYDDGSKGEIRLSDCVLDTTSTGNKRTTIDGTNFEYAVFNVTEVRQIAAAESFVNTVVTMPKEGLEIKVNDKWRTIDMVWEMLPDIVDMNFAEVGDKTISAKTGNFGWTFRYTVKALPTGDFEKDGKGYRYEGYYPQSEADEFVSAILQTLLPDNDGMVMWKDVQYLKMEITNRYQEDWDDEIFELYTQYKIGEVKYFMYEPVLWRKVQTPNGNGYLADKILHAGQFDEQSTDYSQSSIKNFLENEFGNLFAKLEGEKQFSLPKKAVMIDENNGFYPSAIISDSNRIAKPTDFARAMGVYVVSIPLIYEQVTSVMEEMEAYLQFLGNSNYWMQDCEEERMVQVVHSTGDILTIDSDVRYIGIRPVLVLV